MSDLISNGIIKVFDSCSETARCISVIVTMVIDGDIIKVDSQSIRFVLSSAPELDEYNGQEAKESIRMLCPIGSKVLAEDDKQTMGSYGRIISLNTCNGVNLNEQLIESGLCYISTEFCNTIEFSALPWVQNYGCTPKTPAKISPQ